MSGLARIEQVIVVGVAICMAAFISLTLLTSDFWIQLNRLQVDDVCANQPIPITYERTIKRDFYGEWRVNVWSIYRGHWEAYDGANGAFDYKASTPTTDRTMEWLAEGDPRISTLLPGTYRIEVSINANPGTIFSRTAKVESNSFVVRPCPS